MPSLLTSMPACRSLRECVLATLIPINVIKVINNERCRSAYLLTRDWTCYDRAFMSRGQTEGRATFSATTHDTTRRFRQQYVNLRREKITGLFMS